MAQEPNQPSPDDATRTLDSSEVPTVAHRPDGTSPAPLDPLEPVPSSSSLDGGRFAPGTILAGRYRLVALLGRGGMGEVYRAEDLKLGEPVALKFLPQHLSFDGAALARFHREVRVARQIAHRNVCRVHDIGEADGDHFLTMEYIDGEDLSTLLQRIGRLPQDKAAELAGQVCRGLAAAHEAGVLHRDLKPANVMIDGRGRAKITDFGLAYLQDEMRAGSDEEHFVGTPAYMAPEQLRGDELSARTDLYALGLVLYEMFTGAKAFEDEDWRRLVARGGRSGPPTDPASHVEGLDRGVVRVLLRCLDDDPVERPRSALEIAAALPGGDPLRAALEAGETPSPEMVAGAAERGALSVRAGAAWLGLFFAALLALHLGAEHMTLLAGIDPEKSPEILADRAASLLLELGWNEEPSDTFGTYRFEDDRAQRFSGEGLDSWRERADQRPALLTFVYRASTQPIYIRGLRRPTVDSPAPKPGDSLVVLDGAGRLDTLRLDPRGTAPAGTPDWSTLFAWAGLEPADFEPTDPGPLDGDDDLPTHDARAAWTGSLDGREVRVEAAAFGSLLVSLRIRESSSSDRESLETGPHYWLLVGFFAFFAVAVVSAVRNVRQGRGDVRGAVTVGSLIAVLGFVAELVFRHHPGGYAEVKLLVDVLGAAAFRGGTVLLVYLAMEPAVRSRAPELIVSWTRLLRGRWSDPLVARDVLIGMSMGLALLTAYMYLETIWSATPWVVFNLGQKLGGLRDMVGWLGLLSFSNLTGTMSLALVFSFVLQRVRRRWVAGVILFTLGALLSGIPIASLCLVGAMSTCGLLATSCAWLAVDLIALFPTTADPSDWWAWPTAWLFPVLFSLVAILAFRQATGLGRTHSARGLRA